MVAAGAPSVPALSSRFLFLPEIERGARGFTGSQQVSIGDTAGAGPVKFDKHRAARIGSDRRNRSGSQTEAEAMQGRRCQCFGNHRRMRFLYAQPIRRSA
jgi:hypothetical protein